MVEATKKKSQKYYDIPPIPGVIYYLTVNGYNKSFICTGFDGKKVKLNDLRNGYPIKWDLSHFSYLLRKQSWQPPTATQEAKEIDVKVNVEHSLKASNKRAEMMRHNYTKEDLDKLIDDIDYIEF